MSRFRSNLPQLNGGLFLTDAGIETDLIFNKGIDILEFAAHTLLRCNASRQSHAKLDACEVLDDGSPREPGQQYRELSERMPWINIFVGCCGTDLRHVTSIARALQEEKVA